MKAIKNIKDCKTIQKQLENRGYEATLIECEEIWTEYSGGGDNWDDCPCNDDDLWAKASANCLSRVV